MIEFSIEWGWGMEGGAWVNCEWNAGGSEGDERAASAGLTSVAFGTRYVSLVAVRVVAFAGELLCPRYRAACDAAPQNPTRAGTGQIHLESLSSFMWPQCNSSALWRRLPRNLWLQVEPVHGTLRSTLRVSLWLRLQCPAAEVHSAQWLCRRTAAASGHASCVPIEGVALMDYPLRLEYLLPRICIT